jgi:predicted DNA-binding transcriptional regulator YafY
MPVNKNAYLRYRIIDQCLTNNNHSYPNKDYILDKIDLTLGGNVSPYTFDKDIKELKQKFNAPIEFNRKHNGYYYTDESFSLSQFPLTEEEITALDFSTAVLQSMKHTPLFHPFETAIDKVINGYRVGKILGKPDEEIIQVEMPQSNAGAEWLNSLYKSIIEKQVTKLIYKPFNKEAKEHLFHPYLLKEYRNRWYVVGYSSRSQNSIVFALDRIQSLEKVNEKYFTDPDFNPKEYFKYSFGTTHFHHAKPEKVILSFQPIQAKYVISQPLHHSQKVVFQNETELQIEMEVYITQELIMTVLGYGDAVKVLEPVGLIETIKGVIEKMKELY